ncbi:MAG: HsdR family type I site-specific deoxyribonuclease [Caldilinea sp.]
MTRITEKRDVQDRLINYLQGLQWTFIPRYDLPAWRAHDEREPFLLDVLRRQLARLNRWPPSDPRIDALLRRLRLLPANLEGNEHFLHALRNQWTAYDPASQREFNVIFIDYDDLAANEFHFTEEMWVQDKDRRRLDMVLFVNGLPVTLVENKSPRLEDPGKEGFDQVQTTYTTWIPNFVRFPVPFVVAASRLEYGPTWNSSVKAFYKWKTDDRDYGLDALANSFFERSFHLRLLRDYTLFYRIDDATQKYLLRPHQMRTVEKIVERVVSGVAAAQKPSFSKKLGFSEAPDLSPYPNTGLEWHTQGSGKTLTMIVAAHLLRRQPELDSPTVIIVVDRIELEAQMLQNLEAFGLPAVRATSRRKLQELLAADTRGVIVTTIHKFDGIRKHILTRRNVVVLVDEAHRSQEGDLGIDMRAALPNAFFFGFTGTPIDRSQVGKGTFKTFGSPADAEGYHDKYSINESIEDGTTVPLYYTLVPIQLWLDRVTLDQQFSDLLKEFYDVVDEEGAGSQEALSRLLQRADKLMAVLKSPARIDAIVQHLVTHFQEHVNPLGFKAFVVTPDREACMLYKQALDRYLPADWSVVVYSDNPKKDPKEMRDLYLDGDAERQVRKAFRDPDKLPRILIVTEKLLTGYDAPIAYCMYLDKPLKDHTLLQAIARVNRPYADKQNGLIVDTIGVFEDLQRALTFDQKSYSAGIMDLELLRQRFVDLLETADALLAPIGAEHAEDRTERIIDHFFEESVREPFLRLAGELTDAWIVLSPDPFLADYKQRYYAVLDVVETVTSYFRPKTEQRRAIAQFLGRTEALIKQNVDSYEVASPLPLYPINRTLAATIKNDQVSERVKVINLQRSLLAYIDEHKETNPYLESLTAEVEAVIEQLHQRQISAASALEQLQQKTDRAIDAQEERQQSTLDNLAFSLRMTLKANLPAVAQQDHNVEEMAEGVAVYLRENDGWRHNDKLEGQVRLELLRRLLQVLPKPVNPVETKRIVDDLLTMHRITA